MTKQGLERYEEAALDIREEMKRHQDNFTLPEISNRYAQLVGESIKRVDLIWEKVKTPPRAITTWNLDEASESWKKLQSQYEATKDRLEYLRDSILAALADKQDKRDESLASLAASQAKRDARLEVLAASQAKRDAKLYILAWILGIIGALNVAAMGYDFVQKVIVKPPIELTKVIPLPQD